MIIWSGFGLLVPVIVIVAALLGYKIGGVIGGDAGAGVMLIVFLAMAGFAMVFLGRYLKRSTGKVLLDPATNKEVIVGGYHSFFFVPMHIWGWIIGVWCGVSALGMIIVMVIRAFKGA